MAPSKKTAAAKRTAGKKSTPTAAAASENTERRLVQYTPSSEDQASPIPQPAAGEKKERKSYKQMRSNLLTIIRTIDEIKDKLKPGHDEYLKMTPFYHLFKSIKDQRLTILHTRKSDAAIAAVLEQMDAGDRTIKLGSKDVRITPEDVDLIFGIVGGSRKLDISSRSKCDNKRFRERLFPGEKTLNPKLLKSKLDMLVKRRSRKPQALADVARLLSLIVIGTVFFSTSSVTIQWKWLDYVVDLESMQSYNWGEAILKALCDSAAANRGNPQNTQGCTILLLFWLCEHTKLAKRLENEHLPRILNWHLNDLSNVTKETLVGLADEAVDARLLKHGKTVAETQAYRGHLSYKGIVNTPRAAEIEDSSDDDEHPGSDSSSEEEEQKGKGPEGGPSGDEQSSGGEDDDDDDDSSSGRHPMEMACIAPEPEEEAGPSEQQPDDERPAVSSAESEKLLNNLLSENQDLSDTVRDLQAKLESTTSQLNKLTSANAELEGDNQRLKSELSEQLAKIDAETEKVPGAAAGEAGGSSGEEEEELKILRARVKELEEELIKASDQSRPVTEAGEDRSSGEEEEVRLLRARVKELEGEVTNLKDELADFQLSSYMNDYDKVRLENLEGDMKAQETVHRVQIEALQKIIKEREEEISSLQAELCVYEIEGEKDDEEEGSPLRQEAEKIEPSSKAKTRSMVRLVKGRKRKPANGDDDDFQYDPPAPAAKKKAIKKGKKLEASQKPVRADFNDAHVKFLVDVNKDFHLNCGFELEPEVLDKIILHNNDEKTWTMKYFPRINTVVTVSDMTEMMKCTFISNHVVDAFAESFHREHNKKLEALILPAHCWTSIVLGRHDNQKMYQTITDMIPCVRNGIILFPMVSPGMSRTSAPNHWTLLVCDFVQRKWRFYNSIQPRRAKSKDYYMANAAELKENVEINVGQMLEKAGKDGFPIYEIEAVKPLPQQAPTLNECALYVCYYMEKILKKEAIPDKVRTEEFQVFKAHVIRTILTMKEK